MHTFLINSIQKKIKKKIYKIDDLNIDGGFIDILANVATGFGSLW